MTRAEVDAPRPLIEDDWLIWLGLCCAVIGGASSATSSGTDEDASVVADDAEDGWRCTGVALLEPGMSPLKDGMLRDEWCRTKRSRLFVTSGGRKNQIASRELQTLLENISYKCTHKSAVPIEYLQFGPSRSSENLILSQTRASGRSLLAARSPGA